MKILCLGLLSYLMISTTVLAVTGPEVEDTLTKINRTFGFHGSVYVSKGGEVLLEKAFGLANREWSVPNTIDSKFMIASLSKQFTAYAVLNLEAEGKLNIEDSVANYIRLPRNSTVSEEEWSKITLKHLLTHTAGLSRDVRRTEDMSRGDYNLVGTIVSNVLRGRKILYSEPGEFSYSNVGYLFLAEVIQKASKSNYGTYLQRVIFNPLKMRNTGEYHRRKMIPNMAEGYHYGENRTVAKRCCDDASIFTGSHNLYSDIKDMTTWMRALHGKIEGLNQEVVSKMMTPQVDQNYPTPRGQEPVKSYYGFGLVIDSFKGKTRVGHTGHEWGYSSLLSYVPEEDILVVYLSNTHGADVFTYRPNNVEFLDKILDSML